MKETEKLDNVLSGLERMLLSGPKGELRGRSNERSDIRQMIQELLDREEKRDSVEAKKTSKPVELPAGRLRRLAFLRDLIASRPDLSPRIAAVFGRSRKPTETEVDELTKELVRLGILKQK
jgi:hypothetical protein